MLSQLPFLKGTRVLLVEDDFDLASNIIDYLGRKECLLRHAVTGGEALDILQTAQFDIMLLDVRLPGLSGLTVCQHLRTVMKTRTPILMMTAADSLEERLAGFDAGTDDYVVKPFALQEIAARMRALLRRSALPHGDDCLQFGAIKIYPGLRTAYREDKVLELTQMAFRILQALVRVAPNVLTRAELEEILWGDEPPGSDSLRSHVFSLRQTLDRPFEKPMLRTIRGVGLQLVDT